MFPNPINAMLGSQTKVSCIAIRVPTWSFFRPTIVGIRRSWGTGIRGCSTLQHATWSKRTCALAFAADISNSARLHGAPCVMRRFVKFCAIQSTTLKRAGALMGIKSRFGCHLRCRHAPITLIFPDDVNARFRMKKGRLLCRFRASDASPKALVLWYNRNNRRWS